MPNEIGQLFKNEDNNKTVKPSVASKKLTESKRRLNGICRSLLIDSSIYSAKKTVESVDIYIGTTEKVDRILYSEISAFIIGLDEKGRGTFSTNVMSLLQYVLDDGNKVGEDSKRICIKLYDHFQLNLTQIESANNITVAGIAKSFEKESEELNRKVKGIEKEYITILGIFAAIMLAFVGTFTFSTSVLNNIGKADVFTLVIVAVVIGVVFISLVSVLLDFLREINDKLPLKENGNRKWNITARNVLVTLLLIIVVALIGIGISRMKLPETINIGSYHYQLMEDTTEQPIETEDAP